MKWIFDCCNLTWCQLQHFLLFDFYKVPFWCWKEIKFANEKSSEVVVSKWGLRTKIHRQTTVHLTYAVVCTVQMVFVSFMNFQWFLPFRFLLFYCGHAQMRWGHLKLKSDNTNSDTHTIWNVIFVFTSYFFVVIFCFFCLLFLFINFNQNASNSWNQNCWIYSKYFVISGMKNLISVNTFILFTKNEQR